jgi:hypothetical protein
MQDLLVYIAMFYLHHIWNKELVSGFEEIGLFCSSQVTNKDWVQLQGEFLLNETPSRLVIYLEGPSPGTDILVNSLVVKRAEKIPASARPFSKVDQILFTHDWSNMHDMRQ